MLPLCYSPGAADHLPNAERSRMGSEGGGDHKGGPLRVAVRGGGDQQRGGGAAGPDLWWDVLFFYSIYLYRILLFYSQKMYVQCAYILFLSREEPFQ